MCDEGSTLSKLRIAITIRIAIIHWTLLQSRRFCSKQYSCTIHTSPYLWIKQVENLYWKGNNGWQGDFFQTFNLKCFVCFKSHVSTELNGAGFWKEKSRRSNYKKCKYLLINQYHGGISLASHDLHYSGRGWLTPPRFKCHGGRGQFIHTLAATRKFSTQIFH